MSVDRRRSAGARAFLVWLTLVSAPAIVARAHLGSTKYLRVDLTASGARVIADVDPVDLAYELELDHPREPDLTAIVARAHEVRAWATRSFTVRTAAAACGAEASAPILVALDGASRSSQAVRIEIAYDCPAPRADLVLRDDAVFDGDPQHEAVVRIGERATVLRAGRREIGIGTPPSASTTFATFALEGALHLVTGYDHVLFLVSLLLVAGTVAARDGRRRAARDVAIVITGFTIGHSITLIAAALDLVTLPSRLVESAIAASIVIVAGWNLVGPEARRGLPWVALGFGLVHGFGFSSVLRELVLPTGERVAALLAFNVGIEVAQLGVVALVIGPLAWAGSRSWYPRVVIRGGSIAIGAVALVWLVERTLGL